MALKAALPRALVLLASAILLGSCGGAAPAPSTAPQSASALRGGVAAPESGQPADALQAIEAGARKEGALTLVWSENILGGTEGAKEYAQGMKALYGFDLKVQFTPGPSMADMSSKVLQEYSAKQPASSDIFIGGESNFLPLMQAKALAPVDWKSWSPTIQAHPDVIASPGGEVLKLVTQLFTIAYNSNKLKGDAIPGSMQDLLKPQYKGRIAATPYLAGFDVLATPEFWGLQKTLDYTRAFAGQVGGLIRCGETTRLVSGEFDILALECNQGTELKGKAGGQPLDFVIPTDAAMYYYLNMAIPKNAPHPNAAKLFVSYMMTRQAQDIAYKLGYLDNNLLPGSHSAEDVKKLEDKGVTFHSLDLSFMLKQNAAEDANVRKQLQAIIQKHA